MHIAKLTYHQLEMLLHAAQKAQTQNEDFILGYDEMDRSLKYKIGQFVWSPPIITEER